MAQVHAPDPVPSNTPILPVLTNDEQSHQSHQDLVFVIRRQESIAGILRLSRAPDNHRRPFNHDALSSYTGKEQDTREDSFAYAMGERVAEMSDSRTGIEARVGDGGQSNVGMIHREPDTRKDNSAPAYYRQNCYEYGRVNQRSAGFSGMDNRQSEPGNVGMAGASTSYAGEPGPMMIPFTFN